VLVTILYVYLVLLIGRAVIGWVMVFNRDFRPTGPLVVVLEIMYSVTDPPLRLLGRLIPPLRIGNFALDIAFILLFVVVLIAINYASRL
jgi:YggT family protein